ncbi:MAG: hypothetical protein IJ358_01100 [Clostridia bacterium]|nr:hypothetical protein [Clostridia bacterium]
MEKKYKAKNIYLCHIAFQLDVEEVGFDGYRFKWDYAPSTERIALCVKTIYGLKQITTGKIFNLASYDTAQQMVIMRPILKWEVADRKIAKAIEDNKELYKNMPVSVIERYEEHYNQQLLNSKSNTNTI